MSDKCICAAHCSHECVCGCNWWNKLTDKELNIYTKKWFDIHPEAHVSEQFKIKLYELIEFAKEIEKLLKEKNS